MRSPILLAALVLFLGLGIGYEAEAGGKMDWSEYLEPPGARAPIQATPTQRPAKAERASKKISKASAKKSKAKAKKAKRSARNKRHR